MSRRQVEGIWLVQRGPIGTLHNRTERKRFHRTFGRPARRRSRKEQAAIDDWAERVRLGAEND